MIVSVPRIYDNGANPWDALYKEIDPQTEKSDTYDPEMYRT